MSEEFNGGRISSIDTRRWLVMPDLDHCLFGVLRSRAGDPGNYYI